MDFIVDLMTRLKEYRKRLNSVGISDFQIKMVKQSFWPDVQLFVLKFTQITMYLSFALPGLLLNTPAVLILNHLANKERIKVCAHNLQAKYPQCLSKSKVKISGKDVVASYKVKMGVIIFPATAIAINFLLYFLLRSIWFKKESKESIVLCSLYILFYPIYAYCKSSL